MPKGSTFLAVFLLLVTSTSRAESWPGAEWSPGPQATGPAVEALQAYAFPQRDDATRKGVRTDALLVIQHGQVVYERYAGPTQRDTPHLTWSISKSIMATVLGVAYGQGLFQLHDPVAKFYPAFQAHPGVTLEHLLNWSSGVAWQEDYEYAPLNSSVVAMLYTLGHADMAGYTAGQGEDAPPGRSFRYSSGDSNALAAALRGIVGSQRYPDYPWTALFDPLGIRGAVWERDGSGTFVASSYAYLKARDLARIGLLMERNGRWQDRQLLPRAWVDFNRRAFAGYKPGQDEAVGGGQWWLNRSIDGARKPWPDAPADTFAALGHWGQALYVIPSAGLVIVRYGDDRDGSYRHNELLKLAMTAFGPKVQP
ncbi:serine hydrolase domain-containing protein [Pseudomonas vanderleydeniana]|uniref:Beta-lactamase family protein n=1 Tax=Pseudomonas vanderleydeniana TaxID=2745495 RepID=A0A9E6TTT6_9PSED|nr:serine hydrolase [Pseudomonas vanderleydeniana]QXI29846.1 beta-lactamase family protein [Pseudomonas vanderleydeniana]